MLMDVPGLIFYIVGLSLACKWAVCLHGCVFIMGIPNLVLIRPSKDGYAYFVVSVLLGVYLWKQLLVLDQIQFFSSTLNQFWKC